MNLHDDVIYAFLSNCFKAGIKDPTAYLISKEPKTFGWLKGAFPRGILPTDVDGEVEINGYFLRLEFKKESVLESGFGKPGQLDYLRRLTMTNVFTVFVVGTNQQGDPTCVDIYLRGGRRLPRRKITRDGFFALCEQWSRAAAKAPSGTPIPP